MTDLKALAIDEANWSINRYYPSRIKQRVMNKTNDYESKFYVPINSTFDFILNYFYKTVMDHFKIQFLFNSVSSDFVYLIYSIPLLNFNKIQRRIMEIYYECSKTWRVKEGKYSKLMVSPP